MSLLWALPATGCAALGVGLLRRTSVLRRGGWRLVAGWAAVLAAVPAWRLTGSAWDWAAALAGLVPSLIAFAVIAATADWRIGRPKALRVKEIAVIDLPPAGPIWRGLVRTLLAGPLAGVAALGLAALFALHGPGSQATQLVGAGLLLPVAWAGFGVWATTDGRLLRIALGLGGLAGLSFAAALL